jgi:hypothetical protein
MGHKYRYEVVKDGAFFHLRCHYRDIDSIGDVCFRKSQTPDIISLLREAYDEYEATQRAKNNTTESAKRRSCPVPEEVSGSS